MWGVCYIILHATPLGHPFMVLLCSAHRTHPCEYKPNKKHNLWAQQVEMSCLSWSCLVPGFFCFYYWCCFLWCTGQVLCDWQEWLSSECSLHFCRTPIIGRKTNEEKSKWEVHQNWPGKHWATHWFFQKCVHVPAYVVAWEILNVACTYHEIYVYHCQCVRLKTPVKVVKLVHTRSFKMVCPRIRCSALLYQTSSACPAVARTDISF